MILRKTYKGQRCCQHDGCTKQPGFGSIIDKKALFCKTHKQLDHVSVSNLSGRCQHIDCMKIPSYGPIGGKKIFCSKHKDESHTRLRRNCAHDGCFKTPNYGSMTDGKRRFCKIHKRSTDIVIGRKCQFEGCLKNPFYGSPEDGIPKFCSLHKESSHILNKFKCQTCLATANFGSPDDRRRVRCSKHKKGSDVDLVHKTCKSTFCDTSGNRKYEGYCAHCFKNLYPDRVEVRHLRSKELYVKNFIMTTFPDIPWIHDKPILGGCSRRRPDLFADFGTHIVIIEIDEDQHAHYSCESKRLCEIFQDAGNLPMHFVRFNPDRYLDDGKVHKSPWKNGAIVNTHEWNDRLLTLENYVRQCCLSKPTKEILIQELFYNV